MTKYQIIFMIIALLLIGGYFGADIEKNILNNHTCQGLQVTFDRYPMKH